MEIRVIFYGVLAEVTGTTFMTYPGVASFDDLRKRISDEFPAVSNYKYRVCHNRVLVEAEPVLSDGDEVAFLPPFYGG
ncbi:MAG TPA: MoaD/ThiS family protein [Bacteroidales bacterium]|nr:MoaD/ThiS family protein [Bacteroidales bacterium]